MYLKIMFNKRKQQPKWSHFCSALPPNQNLINNLNAVSVYPQEWKFKPISLKFPDKYQWGNLYDKIFAIPALASVTQLLGAIQLKGCWFDVR